MLRLVMASRSRNLPRNVRGGPRSKVVETDAASSRAGISSAPNQNDGRTRLRAHSIQPPPQLPTNSTSQGTAKTKAKTTGLSGSASNINKNRNILRRGGSSTSDGGLSKAFQKLNVNSKPKPAKASDGRRSHSTSAGSSGGTCKSLEDVARRILQKKSKNVVVMAGAGISCPSGIPDFRSPGSGLYDNLKQYQIPYPEAIFDIGFFHRNPKPFFTLAKELYPSGKYRPNYVHYFVRMLYDKGILLRMYTQNIDGLERLAGIPGEKLVEAHGTFTSCTCTKCGFKHDSEQIKHVIYADRIPRCKRPSCTGVVKPDIVFFGEDLPKRFFYYMKDMPLCDLLIIMGTSLEVYPFAGIVDSVRPFIPRLLINREAVGPFKRPTSSRYNDLAVTGDLVECVQRFSRVLGWKKGMDEVIRENEKTLDVMVAEMERKDAMRKVSSSDENADANHKDTDAMPNLNESSPSRLTNLQRGKDTTNNIRKYHTESLSQANSAARSSTDTYPSATKPALIGSRANTSLGMRTGVALLPRIQSMPTFKSRGRVESSDSSDSSSSSESSSSDDD